MEHFELASMPSREVAPGFHGKFVHTEHQTFAFWEIAPGSSLPLHSHPQEQVLQMLEGEFELRVGGKVLHLKAGEVVVIASNEEHSGKALTPCKIIDTFYPVREDYR